MRKISDLEIYGVKQIVQFVATQGLTISKTQVRKLIREGTLSAIKLGKCYVVSSENLEKYLNGRQDAPQSMSSYIARRKEMFVA